MNNASFRSLVNNAAPTTSRDGKDGTRRAPSSLLGSRNRSSMPMTPRSLNASKTSLTSLAGRADTEQTNSSSQGPPSKKQKLNSVPKGSKYASGYVDRSAERRALDPTDDVDEDKRKRLKALETMLKKDEIDKDTFERLRSQLGIGGNTSSTHLVRGLDWALLARVRNGEDVSNEPGSKDDTATDDATEEVQDEENVEDQLEKALDRERKSPRVENEDANDEDHREEPLEQQPQQTLSRDEILRRLKANRRTPGAAKEAEAATSVPQKLSSHFKKIPSASKVGKHKFVESINGRRREVLVITNKDGTTKRKTRWIDPENATGVNAHKGSTGHLLGGDVDESVIAKQRSFDAEQKRVAEEEVEDDDIFGGVAEYDPLASLEDEPADGIPKLASKNEAPGDDTTSEKPRNYFAMKKDSAQLDDTTAKGDPAHDPAILAALKRAAQLRRQEANNSDGEKANDVDDDQPTDPEALAKRQAFLKLQKERDRQDALDIDMGFGESRFDEDDDEGPIYDDLGDADEDQSTRGGKTQRKRGGKKRKGDKNNARDVLDVLAGRKAQD